MTRSKLTAALSAALLIAALSPVAEAGCWPFRCQSRRQVAACAAPVACAVPQRTYTAMTQVATTQRAYAATDVAGFAQWLNAFRSQHGRGPVAVDGNLCHEAAVNSSMGFGHAHMGSARRQNAAVGSIASAQAGWVASPAHLDALLDPSITAIGLGQSGSVITFSAR